MKAYVIWVLNVLMASGVLGVQAAGTDQPVNIIFLMTDDQRWDNFGCYGRPEFRTEHIDQLAEAGVIFDKAYRTVAICMPSRATIFSGRYLSNHRVGFTYPYNLTFLSRILNTPTRSC